MNPDLIKQWVLVAVRYFGPPVIGWLSLKFGITESEATAFIVGGIVYGISFVWALFNKSRYEEKVNTSLDMSKGASKQDLKAVIASGDGTGATAAK